MQYELATYLTVPSCIITDVSLDTGTVVSAVALSTAVTRPVVADSADVTGGGTHS